MHVNPITRDEHVPSLQLTGKTNFRAASSLSLAPILPLFFCPRSTVEYPFSSATYMYMLSVYAYVYIYIHIYFLFSSGGLNAHGLLALVPLNLI